MLNAKNDLLLAKVNLAPPLLLAMLQAFNYEQNSVILYVCEQLGIPPSQAGSG